MRQNFNPRAHEGHDLVIAPFAISRTFQSTCPRGARLTHPAVTAIPTNFNPRAHEGHDFVPAQHLQSLGYFNPRAHEGHDPAGCRCHQVTIIISIHVPTRGTTQCNGNQSSKHYFNPRAHEGHDSLYWDLISKFHISIHVPTRGTTISPAQHPPQRHDFNPRAHEGHDLLQLVGVDVSKFQSTCPRGARLPLEATE